MTDSFSNLRSQLNLLTESFDQLGTSLAENARGMREELVPPDELLAEKISHARDEFVQFREAVLDSAKATIAPEFQVNGQAMSLRGLQKLIEQIETHCTEITDLRCRATRLLDDVLSLRYRGHGSLPELRDCQQRALAVRDNLTASFSVEILPDLKAVANRETTFADLLELINPIEAMDSERATTLSIRLEESFGRRLVVEALRGQIYLPERPEPPAPQPPPAPEPPATASEEVLESPSVSLDVVPADFVPAETMPASASAPTEALQVPREAIENEIHLAEIADSGPIRHPHPVLTDELVTVVTGEIVDSGKRLPEAVEETQITESLVLPPGITENLSAGRAIVSAETQEVAPTTRLDQSEPHVASPPEMQAMPYDRVTDQPLTQSFDSSFPASTLQPATIRYDTPIDEPPPAARHESTFDLPLPAERYETNLNEPTPAIFEPTIEPAMQEANDTVVPGQDPARDEFLRNGFYDEAWHETRQAPPSEIASELASELATLASTLASDLMDDVKDYEISLLAETSFPDLSAYETRTDIIGTELIQEMPAAPDKIRVTEDLAIEEPSLLESSAQEIALSLLKPETPLAPETFSALLWQMVIENRLGLAYHLSIGLEEIYPDMPNRLPSHFIRALALSRAIRFDAGEIASALQNDFSRYDENFFATLDKDPDPNWSYAIQLLMASIALRPALLAPGTQAESVISHIRLNTGLENLAGYCRTIFDFAIYKHPFDYLSLGPVRSAEQWQAEIEELNQQVREWFSQASRFDLEDGMARKIWVNWLMNQGKISSLLQPILQNDIKRLIIVKSDIEALSNDLEIEAEVNKTNREIRGWDAPEIHGRALELICQYTREAIAFVQSWVTIQQSYLRQLREDPINRNRDLRETLLEMRDRVFEDIERFRRPQDNLFLNCAAQLCLRTVSDIDRMLSGAEDSRPENSLREVLHAELLLIPDIPMNRRWEPEGISKERVVRGIIQTVAATRFDWRQAFDLRKKHEDHEATRRIIELLTIHRNTNVRLDELTAERESHLQECRRTLQSSIDMLREKIEAGMVAEWLTEAQRAEYIACIEEIECTLPASLRFFELNDRLKNLNLSLESHCVRMRVENETRHNREISALRNKIESVRFNLKESDYNRILETLEDGDTGLTDEYLRIALRGDELPIKYDEAYYLRAFFPHTLRNMIALSDSILSGGRLLDDANNLLGEEYFTGMVAQTLESWESCKQMNRINEEGLRLILNFLGFNLQKAEQYRTRIPGDIIVTLSPIQPGVMLPIPKYGSDAHQRLRIICLFDHQSPEEMATFISNTGDTTPTIILYFGSLLEEQRRKLALVCNENRVGFLVLDDLLLLHLAKSSEPRIEAFFHCSAPFTFCNPYNPDRPAAPELFVGRSDELQRLLDMKGTSFVFSGRRFGKTSLLLDAKKRFELRSGPGEQDHLALYIDLNAENIGTIRPLDYLWKKLSDLLYEIVGATDTLRQNLGPNLTFSQIRKWLDASTDHKIMLLLDESDTFLRQDGAEGYPRCNRLKNLIDEPMYRQRIKIIFAGGNHVLRSASIENQPLAHPDGMIRIGPMLKNKEEILAAIQLIEKVFTGIGYEFEKPELILRILSWSDYYPHLIQHYCQHLIKSVTGLQVPAFEMEQSPPYILTSKQIRDAFHSPELHTRIQETFLWTMEQDKRYLTLAQLMAYYNIGPVNNGFSASWLRQKALMWWPEGFADANSLFAITELLEEMEQLHLIRKIDEQYYLGTPHLQSLFGTQEDLEVALSNCDKLTPSPQSLAASFRMSYGSQLSRRSPLTMRQFHQMRKRENGVSIIFGCRATDLDSTDLFLAHSLPQEFICMNKYASRSDFVRTLTELQQRLHGVVQILYVPADCSWNEEWMAEAIRHVEKLSGKERYARVVFAADSVKTWRWLSLEESRRNDLNIGQVKPLFSLAPWEDHCLRLWLDEVGIRADDAERAMIKDVTGNWPIMLDKFYRAANADPRNWQHALLALKDSFRDFREELELSMGLHLTDPSTLLRELAKWGRASIEELSNATGTRNDVVERTINWADLLGLITPAVSKESEKVQWQLVPLVQRLLSL